MLEWLFRKTFRKWLEEKALRLSPSERKKIAEKLSVNEEIVQAIEEAIEAEAVRRLDL